VARETGHGFFAGVINKARIPKAPRSSYGLNGGGSFALAIALCKTPLETIGYSGVARRIAFDFDLTRQRVELSDQAKL
jgi:hypothetical protein